LLEELGWTGFAMPRLRLRYAVLGTGLIVGGLWGAWHLPINYWASGVTSGEQARATGQTLRAVHAVDVSPAFNMALGIGAVDVPMDASALDPAYREAVTSVFDSVRPGPGWRLQFFSGEAGPPVLVAESAGAALLVVGTKEHVGIGRLVRGSVSHYCLSQARCPLVAVPAVRDHDADKDYDHDRAAAVGTDTTRRLTIKRQAYVSSVGVPR